MEGIGSSHNTEKSTRCRGLSELPCYDLDPILHIDGRYIKSECFAGEFRDVLETLNSYVLPDQFHETSDSGAHTIKDGSNPMEYGSP